MSVSENKVLAQRYYHEVANAPLASAQVKAELLLTADFTFYPNVPEPQRGIEAHKMFLARHHEVSPDQQWICQEMIAEGNTIVCRLTIKGTHRGVFHGIAPTGRRYSIEGVDFFRMVREPRLGTFGRSRSKIAEIRRYLDLQRLLEQMRGETEADPNGA